MPRAEGKRLSRKRIALLIVTAAVLLFIFVQSVFPRSLSLDESETFSEGFLDPIFRLFGLDPLSQTAVRKAAHILEFTALSFLLALCFRGNAIKSFGAGFATAFLDESLQLLSDRGAMLTDVWIDLIGVALGTAIGTLVYQIIGRCHTRRNV